MTYKQEELIDEIQSIVDNHTNSEEYSNKLYSSYDLHTLSKGWSMQISRFKKPDKKTGDHIDFTSDSPEVNIEYCPTIGKGDLYIKSEPINTFECTEQDPNMTQLPSEESTMESRLCYLESKVHSMSEKIDTLWEFIEKNLNGEQK